MSKKVKGKNVLRLKDVAWVLASVHWPWVWKMNVAYCNSFRRTFILWGNRRSSEALATTGTASFCGSLWYSLHSPLLASPGTSPSKAKATSSRQFPCPGPAGCQLHPSPALHANVLPHHFCGSGAQPWVVRSWSHVNEIQNKLGCVLICRPDWGRNHFKIHLSCWQN